MTISYKRIYDAVCNIPKGKVATYGQIAAWAGYEGQARHVGYALAALKEGSDVPWHRVINAKGEVSARNHTGYDHFQKRLLEDEGVFFSASGKVDLGADSWVT